MTVLVFGKDPLDHRSISYGIRVGSTPTANILFVMVKLTSLKNYEGPEMVPAGLPVELEFT